uniref:ACB domain-containing protein n=1 Tax=Glossina pallidipes TaxID=7398 RepID=A0A1A9ZFA7_GLOPL
MATVQERFQAAVNVIKGLPKNGPYQPTTTMMLKFYGLYKQATEGPCNQNKPKIWDVVGRTKWEAWNKNRHLSKEEAMEKYVQDLQEIIETMSFTENVQNFVGSLSGLENINLDELDIIAPGMKELAESHPNSPFNSRTNSPQHGRSNNVNAIASESVIGSQHLTEENSEQITVNTNEQSTENAEINGIRLIPVNKSQTAGPTSTTATIDNQSMKGSIDQSDDEYVDPFNEQNDFNESLMHNTHILKQVQLTIAKMNSDIAAVNHRLIDLEKSVIKLHHILGKSQSFLANNSSSIMHSSKYPKWWPFSNISPAWFMFLILWPFVIKRMAQMLSRSHRK